MPPPPGVTPPPQPAPVDPVRAKLIADARARLVARARERLAARQAPTPAAPAQLPSAWDTWDVSQASPQIPTLVDPESAQPGMGLAQQGVTSERIRAANGYLPPISERELGYATAVDRSAKGENVLIPEEPSHSVLSSLAGAPAAIARGVPDQLMYGTAGALDAVGLMSPTDVADIRMSHADTQRAQAMDVPNPTVSAGVDLVNGLAPFVSPYTAPVGIATMGGSTFEDALQAGATRGQAATAGLAMSALGAAMPGISRAATPLADGIIGEARGILADRARGAVVNAPAGAAFGTAAPAIESIYDPNAQVTPEGVGGSAAVMSALGALFGHAPHAPGKPNVREEPAPQPKPVAEAPASAAPTPEAKPTSEPTKPQYAKAPATAEEAVKFSQDYANEVGGGERRAPPYKAPLGQMFDNLPNGESGRLIDYVPSDTVKNSGRRAIRYKFRTESGQEVTYPASELFAHEEAGNLITPRQGDYQPVVVKRHGTSTPAPVETPAPADESGAPRPATETVDAPPAPSEVAPDEPRPFERQEGGSVQEVQDMARAAQQRLGKKPAMAEKWLQRELAKPNPDPERVAAYRRMVEAGKRQEPAPVTAQAPDVPRESNPVATQRSADREPAPTPSSVAPRDTEGQHNAPLGVERQPVAPRPVPARKLAEPTPVPRDRLPAELGRPEVRPQPEIPDRQVEPNIVGDRNSHLTHPSEPADTVEHRAREYGLTREEARTVAGKPGTDVHPDIPEHVRSAAEFVSGRKAFESKQQWQQWWGSLPESMRRGVRELTGVNEGDVTSTDAEGHVVTANPRPVSEPPRRHVRVSNLEGSDRSLEMAVRPLEPDANISYTAGSEAKGNVETLPRYYVGQVTDQNAPPGARGKWVVLDWNPNNDEHVQQSRGQRVPFVDIPTLKAIGGNGKRGLQKSDIYDSYTDAKNAALDIVAKTKRNRDFSAAEKFGQAKPEEMKPGDLTEQDQVAPEDIKSGRASFRTREQLTRENPDAVFRQGEGEQYRYDKTVDDTIEHLEKLRAQGKTADEVANDPKLLAAAKAIDALGQQLARRGGYSRHGGTVDWLNAVADAIERFAKYVANLARRAAGYPAKKLTSFVRTATQVLERIKTPPADVSPEFREAAVNYAEKALSEPSIRARLQALREAGATRSPLRKQLIQAYRQARAGVRWLYSRYRHLNPRNPMDARFANKLRLAQDAGDAAKNQAAVAIAHYTQGVRGNAEHYRLFSDKVILDDLVRSVDEGLYAPEDIVPFTGKRVMDGAADDLKAELAKINAEIEKTPAVKTAVEARANEWFQNVTGPLAAIGQLPAHLADPTRPYYHRQVLKYYGDEAAEARSVPLNQRVAGSRPSTFKRRGGAADPYNTAFEESELAAMSQSLAALNRKLFDRQLDDFSKHLDVQDAIHEWNSDKFENMVFDGDKAVNTALAKLGTEVRDGLTVPPKYKSYADLFDAMRRGEDISNHPELSQFLGDVVRSRDYLAVRLKKDTLGNQYRDPQDMYAAVANGMAPEDYVPIQTEDGNQFRVVDTVNPRVADEARESGEAALRARDIGEALMLAGAKPQRLIPKRFADQMGESLEKKPTTGLERIAPPIARNLIHNPLVLPLYLGTNAVTNASMAWLSNPLVFRKIPAALKLLSKFHYRLPTNEHEKALLDEMVQGRVIQQHFAGQYDSAAKTALESLARHSKRAGFSANTWQERARWVATLYRSRVARPLASMVDDVFKAADYLHQKDVESGKFSGSLNEAFAQKYGATAKREYAAAESPEEAAAIHARQGFVDYGSVSRFADSLAGRRGLQPFYTWVEGEMKWVGRIMRNAFDGDPVSKVANTAKLALKIAAMHTAIALWNEMHDEETKKRAREAGIDPLNNLIIGQTSDGRVRYFPAPLVTTDFMHRIGLGDFYNKWKATVGGESSTATVGELLAKAPKTALMQQAASATPLVTFPVAATFGVRINPKAGSLSPVQPNELWQTALSGLGARAVANMLDDSPRPRWTLADLITRADSPEDQTYYRAKQLIADWKQKTYPNDAAPSGADERSLAGNAMHDMKAAIKLKDYDAAAQALNQYYYALSSDSENHTPANLKQSIAATSPENGLGAKRAEFEASLTPTERETWEKANSDFHAWSDPYRNPDLTRVLDIAAGADQKRYHEQTKLYAGEVAQKFNALKSNLSKAGDNEQALRELTATIDDAIAARSFERLDAAATKLERVMKAMDPTRSAEVEEQANYIRELAREAFAPARPATHGTAPRTP